MEGFTLENNAGKLKPTEDHRNRTHWNQGVNSLLEPTKTHWKLITESKHSGNKWAFNNPRWPKSELICINELHESKL